MSITASRGTLSPSELAGAKLVAAWAHRKHLQPLKSPVEIPGGQPAE